MKKDKHELRTDEQNSQLENNENALKNDENKEEKKAFKDLEDELKSSKEKIEQLEKELHDYNDKLLRRAAEFENYKRRTENDQLNLLKYSAETFIVKLLPVVDDFERSLQHLDTAKDIESLKQGIQLIYDKFMKILNDQGVAKIDAVGKSFDVQYHEAMLQRKEKGVAPHTVLDEIEKGYIYKDRVIRHSKVIVSEDTNEETETSESNSKNNSNLEDK
jgi:molecular chaperone GrpE